MDHITRALERAQTEQQTVRSWVRPTAEATVSELKLAPKKSVTLSEEHLREHHILCGVGKEDPAVSDRYRLLRTRVTQQLRQQGWNTLGVTSPGPKDGKSLTSINLAISIAREGGYTVVLVDADLRKPSLADDLGITVEKGLIDYLCSPLEFEDVLLGTDIGQLFILPGRRDEAPSAVPELLSSDKMRRLIESLRGRERCILVVDLPPVRLGDDVVALAPYLDTLLLVVREGGTSIDELKESAELLKDVTLLGTVLNQSSERKHHFEGYYHHGPAPA